MRLCVPWLPFQSGLWSAIFECLLSSHGLAVCLPQDLCAAEERSSQVQVDIVNTRRYCAFAPSTILLENHVQILSIDSIVFLLQAANTPSRGKDRQVVAIRSPLRIQKTPQTITTLRKMNLAGNTKLLPRRIRLRTACLKASHI